MEGLYDRLETVYAGLDAQGRVRGVFSGDEAEVLAWAGERGLTALRPLSTPLPAALAERVTRAVSRQAPGGRLEESPPARLTELARRELRRCGLPHRFRSEALPVTGEGDPHPEVREAVRAALRGRRLLACEVSRFASHPGRLFPEAVVRALTWLRLAGEIGSQAAVGWEEDGTWRCRRCGYARPERTPCAHCGDPSCPVCPQCSLLGEARACRRLYCLPDQFSPPPLERPPDGVLEQAPDGGEPPWPGRRPLTPAQRRAAQELVRWLCDLGAEREALLWAVCGAGKTAVARPLIEQALTGGWKVLYASPRRQVIRQVAEELPRTGLVLATTHQCLRYQEGFDLVVLDEPDAYPYRGQEWLQTGLKRAAKAGARWVYLTATPEPQLLARVDAGEVRRVLLPQRFHGRPAPLPQLCTPAETSSLAETRQQGVTALAAEIIRARLIGDGRRCLVFVPTVALSRQAREELARRLGVEVAAVHAASPDRDEVIAAFRRGEVSILVSTSVLERGVTFPSLDVLVLQADHPLLDRVSLLQMAGRAGRTDGDAASQVWLVGDEISPEMAAARRWAEELEAAAG